MQVLSLNDPPQATKAVDYVVVTVIVAGCAMMLLGNAVILCNRHYRPIRSKSVPLTVVSSLGGLVWISASLVVNDHFPRRKGSGLEVCPLWTFWLQACFGFGLWLNCLTLRLIQLFRIFICKWNNRTYDYLLLIPLLLPVISLCIVASVKNPMKFMLLPPPNKKKGDCRFDNNSWLAYGLVALLVLYFLIFLGFSFKLRNTMAQFNEFRLIRRGGLLSLFLFLFYLVTLKTHDYNQPYGRCFLSAAVASAIFYYFWARNGLVIYNVLFNRTEFLEGFNKDLTLAPSEHEREKCPGVFLKMANQLKEVRAEVQKYQERIRQLEEEVKALELDCCLMQAKTSSHSSSIVAHDIVPPTMLKDLC